jgi:hypothetical protein
MKNIPLILAVGILVVFGLLLTGMYLWAPLNIRYYRHFYYSESLADRVRAVDGFFAMGRPGYDELGKLIGNKKESEFVLRYWETENPETSFPIAEAVDSRFYTAVELFAGKGANLGYGPNLGYSVFFDARKDGRQNCFPYNGMAMVTPLGIAIMNRDVKMAKLLLKYGAKTDVWEYG